MMAGFICRGLAETTPAELKALRGKSYAEIAARVTPPFLDGI